VDWQLSVYQLALTSVLNTWGLHFTLVLQLDIISIWNKEELPDQWKESILVPVYKKGDKTDCSNYRGISLL
jgi:hypothetical protein